MENSTYPKSLDDVIERFKKNGLVVRDLEPETVSRQQRNVSKLLPKLGVTNLESLKELTPEQTQRFMVAFSKDNGPGAYHWAHYSLGSFFRYCESDTLLGYPLHEWIPHFHKPKLAKVPFFLSRDEIEKILNSVDLSEPDGIRNDAILSMLAFYGVRAIQIRKLKLSDIDWENDRIHFPAVKRGKSVVMPLIVAMGNRLVRYLKESRPKSSFEEVFLTSHKKCPINNTAALCDMVAKALKKAGLRLPAGIPVGTHLFRHSFASRLLEKECPFKHIADLLGHRNLDSTFIYTKVDLKSLEKVCLEWNEVKR